MPKQRRVRVKVCLVGESGVGKTSLIRRFIHDQFDERYIPTPSTLVSKVDLLFPHNHDSEITLEMDLWDITGQSAFRKFLSDSYFHHARSIVAVCDVSRSKTLHQLEEWINAGRDIAGKVQTHTLANKVDLPSNVVINDPKLKQIANQFGAPYYFVSARTGENVDFAFQTIAETILKEILSELDEKEGVMRKEWEILDAIAKRGKLGASKEYFFTHMRGIGFDTLKSYIERLEEKGFLRVSWTDASNFIAFATDAGLERAQMGPELIEDEYLDMVV
ncbi:MAG: GTP-binding protein [Methanobacteriota archaeon]|nr:MAG: GTP-binding protein [Euryarchaeota archaeon]